MTRKTSNELVVTFEWYSFDLRQGYANSILEQFYKMLILFSRLLQM